MKMIRLLILSALFFTSTLAWTNSSEPCNCTELAKKISVEKSATKSLMLYADWSMMSHEIHIDGIKEILSIKTLNRADRQSYQKAMKIASQTKRKLVAVKGRIAKMKKMSKSKFGSTVAEISSISAAGMKSTSMFFKKKPPKGAGDCGDDYIKPDCSTEAGNVGQACSGGVQIMAQCGFYSENGGAAAMQNDLDMCGATQQSVMQLCISAARACMTYSGSFANRNFEADAYSVCSQFENDRTNMDPAQTETSSGR